MKKILIVDKDASTLTQISQELRPYEMFQIMTAERAKQAARLLELMPVDLVLTEIDLPSVNGFQLLIYLKKKYPGIPALAMGGSKTSDIQDKLNKLTISRYFEKPLNIDRLTETIFDTLEIVAAGRIHGISLASFLQLVDLEKKTCTLTIKSKNKTGRIYCSSGDVIAAQAGETKGKTALYQMLFWDRAVIEIKEKCLTKTRNIDVPLMFLLMESHLVKDEIDEELPDAPSIDTALETPPRPPPDPDDSPSDDLTPSRDLETLPRPRMETDPGGMETAITEDIASLEKVLNRLPDIDHYAIVDETGSLRAHTYSHSPSFSSQIIHAFEWAGSLSEIMESDLRFMDIWTSRCVRHTVAKYRNLYLICRLAPGRRATDIARKVGLFNEVRS